MPILLVSAMSLATKALGFLEKQVLAYFLGIGPLADAYLLASSAAMALFIFVREIIEPTFLPLFVGARVTGQHELAVGHFQWGAMLLTALGVSCAIAALLLAAPAVTVLAPGLSATATEHAEVLLRWAVPAGALLALSSLTYLTLNALGRFGLPAAGDVALKLGLIAGTVLAGTTGLGAVGLGLGMLVGASARLATHCWGLGPWYSAYRHHWLGAHVNRRAWAHMAAPIAMGSLFAQLGDLAENGFASTIDSGAIAARSYASKIIDVPVLLIPYATSIVLYPRLAELHSGRKDDEFFAALAGALRPIACLFLPLAVCGVLLAHPTVSLLLKRGAFTAEARDLTAQAMQIYALGMPVFALEALLVPAFFARQDTRRPVLYGMAAVTVELACMSLLVPRLGLRGLASALVIAKLVKLALLRRGLARMQPLGFAQSSSNLSHFLLPTGLALLTGSGLEAQLGQSAQDGASAALARCVLVTLAVFVSFFASAWLLPGTSRRGVAELASTGIDVLRAFSLWRRRSVPVE